jgi:putative CocE/NonD family hydrolase
MTTLIDCGGGVRLERGVPCRMSDGVTLYADHYYPPQPGPQPTLLMRQPYGRDIASTVVYAHPAWFARHGYNVVIQDVRGRGDSEGVFYPFRYEGRDGAETIAALRERRESNGRIGMYGFSYQGITQLLAAAQRPPGLVCIAPAMTAHDLYHGWFYHGGALRLASTLGWGLQMLREDVRRLQLDQAGDQLEAAWSNLAAQYLITPYNRHPALSDPSLPSYVRDWVQHDAPGDFWSALDLSQSLDKIEVPGLHISGWYDTYLQGSIDCFLALRASAGSAHARERQYLLAGPWIHIPWGDRIGPYTLGSNAAIDTDDLLLRWCNHWLKDSGEFGGEPIIRHYALNQDTWHSALSFPKPTYTLYLHSEGRANSSKGDGLLSWSEPTTPEPPDLFIYDPEVPIPAPGGLTSAPGPLNQASLELGNNVLIYTSAPLDLAMHVFGAPQVSLHASSSAAHVDFVVKLICLRPNGEATFVTIGIERSRHCVPDTPAQWSIELQHTSCVFAPGDRIRLEVASSAFPLYDRNPCSAVPAPQAGASNFRRSTQILYHDPQHLSALYLPVIPPRPGLPLA